MLNLIITPNWPAARHIFLATMVLASILLISGCTKKTETVRYIMPPPAVSLIFPAADSVVTDTTPTFVWHALNGAGHYGIQVAKTSDFVSPSIDTQTGDTSYTALHHLVDNTYFWRVRGQDINGFWGDWSDAEIRSYFQSDYANYFTLVSQTYTNGIAQDAFTRNDTAYVADGQADLSIYYIGDHANPTLLRNIKTGDDDFAKGVYVAPASFTTDPYPYAWVADMDGKIQALNVSDTNITVSFSFGTDQNLEDLTGFVKSDTLWILAVASGFNRRHLSFWRIQFEPTPNPYTYFYPMSLPADAMGIYADTNYAYIACGTAGLKVISLSDIYNPMIISTLPISGGTALSVDIKDNVAGIAADRAGFIVASLSENRMNPSIAKSINTLGRTKDVKILGNYAYIADADQGLRAVDVSNPDSAHIVASYKTPYAYGVFADFSASEQKSFIYVCDRDLGLLIFEIKPRQ